MRSEAEKRQLCLDFVQANCPFWILNPELTTLMHFREVTFKSKALMRGARGFAYHNGRVEVSTDLAKFRHASPYTAPRGKADISPVGVFAHEMGHILDFALRRSKTYPEVRQMWRQMPIREAVTSYAGSSVGEDFAESHRLFVLNPKLLKQLSPSRFQAIRAAYSALTNGAFDRAKWRISRATFNEQFTKLVH